MEYPRFSEAAEFGPELLFRYKLVLGSNDIFNPHKHDYYEIFMTLSGTVTHWINNQTKELVEGSLVFIRPDDQHGYMYDTPKSNETVYINLSFRRSLLENLFEYLSDAFPSQMLLSAKEPPAVVLNKGERDRIAAQLEELNTVSWKNQQAMNLRMQVILADIFTRVFADLPHAQENREPQWLTHLIAEMQQPEHFIAGTERMVELSRHSREHLCRSLQKYRKITLSSFINDLRINYASNLLIHTNTPVLDICYSCGFQSASNFYKAFAAAYPLSPVQFRKKYR